MGMVKRGLNQLYGAMETVEGLGTTRERVRWMQQSLLSLKRVLSIYFQIVLMIVQTIQKVEMVAPSIFVPGDGVSRVMVEYVNKEILVVIYKLKE